MTLSGNNETILYTFEPSTGTFPEGLIADAAGDFYGTTYRGGSYGTNPGDGVLFELSSAQNGWTEFVLHDFGAGHDGVTPTGGLLMDDAGNLYGSTGEGGEGMGSELGRA